MEYVTLGRTGLRVSVAGLGCGGFSRLGLDHGKSEAEAIGIIHRALDLGVNLFDTAAAYDTEWVVGKALRDVPREEVVICTKAPFAPGSPQTAAHRAPYRGEDSMALRKFIIERDIPAAGTLDREQLRGAAAKSNGVLRQLGPDIQWVESYVAADKTFCVYLAKDEDIIKKHAEISGFPATKITEVRKMIDPTTEKDGA